MKIKNFRIFKQKKAITDFDREYLLQMGIKIYPSDENEIKETNGKERIKNRK